MYAIAPFVRSALVRSVPLCSTLLSAVVVSPAMAESSLFVSYPPEGHETYADRIFIIGTAAPTGEVFINGEAIDRSPDGHFAPSIPLQPGRNVVVVRYGDRQIERAIVRLTDAPPPLVSGFEFAPNRLEPARDIARQPGETVCFSAVVLQDDPEREIEAIVRLDGQIVPLLPDVQQSELPSNLAVLTGQNQPISPTTATYRGCTQFERPGRPGQPTFELRSGGADRVVTRTGPGAVEILALTPISVARVLTDGGVARTGPSTAHSRLTPLPRGTRAAVTGREGDWLRLDYGAWIHRDEVEVLSVGAPPIARIRSISDRQTADRTDVFFPLESPVPVSVEQNGSRFSLTLYNTITQTDFIAFNANPWVERMTWQQVAPDRAVYHFDLATAQQWGYSLRYDDSTLILSLRHPPEIDPVRPLAGRTIVLDPGHGGPEDLGGSSPTGVPEKEFALTLGLLLRDELERRGARVVLTRDRDVDLGLRDRVQIIEKTRPDLALSLHYNALPDSGDAENTAGIGTFWYHPQAQDLAVFLYRHLVEDLNRPEYGVFWANFALTRPAIAPTVLLELGFSINPREFEWISDPEAQQALAVSLADGLEAWMQQARE